MNLSELFGRKKKLEQEIKLGAEAEYILGHALIEGFFAEYERQLFKAWRNSPAGQEGDERRDEAYRMAGIMDAFKARMRSYISTANSSKPILVEVNEELEAAEKE